ncbi:MAG: universal stress protein [Minicystis sp.]
MPRRDRATSLASATSTSRDRATSYASDTGSLLHVVRSSTDAAAGAAEVAALAASLGMGVPATPITRVGNAAAEIVRHAEEHDVDLIVVGGHGRTGVTRALLGSVAEHVARISTRPVLVVPRDHGHPAPAPATHRCVVCGNATEDLVCEPCRTNIRTLGGAERWARETGFVGELARDQCELCLRRAILCRLGCSTGGHLYVVPMAYAYDDGAV